MGEAIIGINRVVNSSVSWYLGSLGDVNAVRAMVVI